MLAEARLKDADSDGPCDRACDELGSQHIGCGRHRMEWVSAGSGNYANIGNGDTLRVDTRPGQNGGFPAMDGIFACREDGQARRARRRSRHRVPLTSR